MFTIALRFNCLICCSVHFHALCNFSFEYSRR